MERSMLLVGPLVAAFAAASASCIDPVHADAVAALGPEPSREREGPRHRPGQPCLVCHGGEGPGPDFVVAGTVYAVRGGTKGLEGAVVVMKDATGREKRQETNEVGNFYLTERQWSPVFPLTVHLEHRGDKKEMDTRIGRDGGCASCHRGDGDPSHMPPVYMRDQ
jgi:hypothetical protein